ncbi:MAG TPA: AMP-binding protein [Acidimicrobiales bacterium]|nr:AMP-binding protein [Acidimicrobiales bacterium]
MVKSLDLVDGWSHRGDATVADRVAVATRTGGSGHGPAWGEITYAALDRRSTDVATRLTVAGVGAGDRVALQAEPGGDWAAAFLGILRRGAVAVPLDLKLTADELGSLCRRSRLAAALVSPAYASRWPDPAPVLDPSAPATADGAPSIPGETPSDLERSRPLSDPAVLVWTSGSTGEPKGVVLSFANLAYVVARAGAVQRIGPEARWLSVLPPNHLLELCCGLLPALAAGSTTFVARTIVPHELGSMMVESRVDRMVVVPVVLRMLKRHIESAIAKRGLAGAYLRTAGRVAAVAPSRTLRRALHAPLHRRLGGHLRAFYCGGAPLDPAIVTFFDRLGIGVYLGYGLTEAAPTVSMNSPGHNRVGSVGRPLPGTDVRIAADDEILVHGPGVMLGYWDDDESSREAVDPDGWLHTGDLGRIDDDGYLFVTGRSKSMIVLDSGKKVQPEEVETALERGDLFAEVCVLGWRGPSGGIDGPTGEQVCAVVVPARSGSATSTPMSEDEAAGEVRRLTAGLSGFKRPTVVRVHEGGLPQTAKRSLRRAEVAKLLDAGAETAPTRAER